MRWGGAWSRANTAQSISVPALHLMIPELFHIGPLPISPFGLTLVAAFFLAFLQLRWGMKRLSVGTEDDANGVLLAAAVGAIVGGKAYYALLYRDWHLLFSRGGIVYYGSFLVASLFVYILFRRRGLPVARMADAVVPALAAGYAVGRVGCLLVGDDYGVPTDLPWGLRFPYGPIPSTAGAMARNFGVEIPPGTPADTLLAVHPTQIYESLTALAILLLCRWLINKSTSGGADVRPSSAAISTLQPGTIALVGLSLLSLERFLVEFLRAKDDRFLGGTLTMAQLISLSILSFLAILWWRRRSSEVEVQRAG